MQQNISGITILVRDYDEAIAFYTGKMGFHLVEDRCLNETTRWVMLIPPGATETHLLLARADGPAQEARVGDQSGAECIFF